MFFNILPEDSSLKDIQRISQIGLPPSGSFLSSTQREDLKSDLRLKKISETPIVEIVKTGDLPAAVTKPFIETGKSIFKFSSGLIGFAGFRRKKLNR